MSPTDLDQQTLTLLFKGALFSTLALIAGHVLTRSCSAQTMSRFWRGVAVALIALPLVALYLPVIPMWEPQVGGRNSAADPGIVTPGSEWRVSYPDSPAGETTSIEYADLAPAATAGVSASSWFTALWLFGAALIFTRWLVASLAAWRIAKNGTASRSDEWHAAIRSIDPDIASTRVLLSAEAALPMAVGSLRPVLLLPDGAKDWDAETRDAVLAHELAHIRRRDPLFLMLVQLAVSLHWINPLAWIVARRARLADERTADDAVLASGARPDRYASLLVDFARRATTPAPGVPIAAPSMAHRSTVGHRVERLLDDSQRRGTPRAWLSTSMLLSTLALAFIAGALTTREASAQEKPERLDTADAAPKLDPAAYIEAKLQKIIIPSMAFEEATVEQAAEFLRMKSREHDPEPDQQKKGINIVIQKDALKDAKPITLNLVNIPLADALHYTTQLAGCKMRVEPYGIVIGKDLPEPLFTQTFRVPGDLIDLLQPVPDLEDADPFGAPGARENSIVKLLQNHGIVLGEGGSATHDTKRSTLVVRGTQDNMDSIEVLLADLTERLPAMLRIRVELYEMPKPQALGIIRETDSKPSADAAIETVQELVKNGDARLLASPSLITRSGQRAKIEAGENVQYVASYKAVEGKDIPMRKSVLAGTSVEVDPTLGADSQTIDINVAISMARGEPTIRKRKVVAPASGLEREVESVSISAQTLTLGFTTLTGQTQLIGNLQSEEVDNPDAVLAFVTATVTRAMRE